MDTMKENSFLGIRMAQESSVGRVVMYMKVHEILITSRTKAKL